jgi:hypothetical protein
MEIHRQYYAGCVRRLINRQKQDKSHYKGRDVLLTDARPTSAPVRGRRTWRCSPQPREYRSTPAHAGALRINTNPPGTQRLGVCIADDLIVACHPRNELRCS